MVCPEVVEHRSSRRVEGFIRYRRGKMLGKGGFAMVYQFTDLVTGDELAAKVIS